MSRTRAATIASVLCFFLHSFVAEAAKAQATLVLGTSTSAIWRSIVQSFSNYQHCVLILSGSSTSNLDTYLRKKAALDSARDVYAQKNDSGGLVDVLATSGSCSLGNIEITHILLLDANELFEVTKTDTGGPSALTENPSSPRELFSAPEGLRAEYFLDRILQKIKDQRLPPCNTKCRDYHRDYVGANPALRTVLENLLLLSDDALGLLAKRSTPEEVTGLVTKAVIEASSNKTVTLEPGDSCGDTATLSCDASAPIQCTMKCGNAAVNLSRKIIRVQRELVPSICVPFLAGHDVPPSHESLVTQVTPSILLAFSSEVVRPFPLKWKQKKDGSFCRSEVATSQYVFHAPMQPSEIVLQALVDNDAPVIARDRLQKWISITVDQEFDRVGKVSRILFSLYLASPNYKFDLKYPKVGFFKISNTSSNDNRIIAVELTRLKPTDDLSWMVDAKSITIEVPFRFSN